MKKLFNIIIKILVYFKITKIIKLILNKNGFKIVRNDIKDFNFIIEKILKILSYQKESRIKLWSLLI